MLTTFQKWRTMPIWQRPAKIEDKGYDKTETHFLSIRILMLSGPILYELSSWVRTLFTVLEVRFTCYIGNIVFWKKGWCMAHVNDWRIASMPVGVKPRPCQCVKQMNIILFPVIVLFIQMKIDCKYRSITKNNVYTTTIMGKDTTQYKHVKDSIKQAAGEKHVNTKKIKLFKAI